MDNWPCASTKLISLSRSEGGASEDGSGAVLLGVRGTMLTSDMVYKKVGVGLSVIREEV
jgi:hypothetical protein